MVLKTPRLYLSIYAVAKMSNEVRTVSTSCLLSSTKTKLLEGWVGLGVTLYCFLFYNYILDLGKASRDSLQGV